MQKIYGRMLLFCIPFALIVLSYVVFDPFKVVRSYAYYPTEHVILNRDYVSTEMYLKNVEAQQYNAFIFGSSRTLAYKTADWQKHLPKDASPYMFDASGESVFGIWRKVMFLDSREQAIDHSVVILCGDCSFAYEGDHAGILFKKHPYILQKEKPIVDTDFLSGYFRHGFFMAYLDWKTFGTWRGYMKGLLEQREIHTDSLTNDNYIAAQDRMIAQDSLGYYRSMADVFYARAGVHQQYGEQISDKQLQMLKDIALVFKKRKTDYRIILSPLYDQKKWHPADMEKLRAVFGKGQVFDYSGVNAFTNPIGNYYESSHYRIPVGRAILNEVYAQ